MRSAVVVMNGPSMSPALPTVVWSVPHSLGMGKATTTADALTLTGILYHRSEDQAMPVKYEYEVWTRMGGSPEHRVRTFVTKEAADKHAKNLKKAYKGKDSFSVRVKRVSYRA